MSYIPINPASLFDSPVFTGDPRAPTPIAGDNDTSVATTAFVTSAVVAGGAFVDAPSDSSLYGRQNAAWLKAAPLASPGLTGNPTAPTPTAGDNGISIATTAFVTTALASGGGPPPATVPPLMDGAAAVGVTTKYAREDHRHPTDTTLAPLASPGFTGTPTAPTATGGTSTTQLATTAFVQAAVSAGGTFVEAPVDGSLYGRLNAGWTKAAPLASPVLTGTPAAPTATGGTNSTQIATTAFVQGELTAKAPLASPAFTGNPTAPTATAGDNDTSIATTAFVTTAVAGVATVPPATVAPLMNGAAAVGVATKYAREDHVHPTDTSLAPLASPTFTGDPKAPTPTAGDNDTSIATTAFVTSAITTAGATYQPLDADLTALAATSGTNTIYYRSAANTWSAVTMGGNMTFTAGVLNSTAGGGGGITDAPADSKTYARNNANWVDIALTYQPLDADLTAIAALSGTNNIYYRSAANTWSSVTIGSGLTFSAGTLAAPGGVTPAALTRTDDTNVTLTLGGTPATALLQATSLTLGWTGTLSTTRGGLGANNGAANGVPLFAAGAVTMTSTTGTGNIVRAADPVFTGNPTAPTPTVGDNDTSIATTAFVMTAVAAAPSILSSTWLAGANPGGSTIFVAPRALTITSLVGVVDTANGAAATVSVVKAASGTALASGTVIHSGSFNANGTAATNQTLTLTTTTMASGDRLGLTSTGTFTASIASITVTVT
jgi:hypothetical protein